MANKMGDELCPASFILSSYDLGLEDNTMNAELDHSEITCKKLEKELIDLFCNDGALMDEWLNMPISRLSGERPLEMFDSSQQRQLLFDVIQEMKYGETA